MKVIALVLAIVVSVVAQEMKGSVLLRLNCHENTYAGLLDLTQPSPGGMIAVGGTVQKLAPKLYVAMVHRAHFMNRGCENLGPIKKLNNPDNQVQLFIFSFVNITTAYSDVTGRSLSATLQPGRPNSIGGYVIALYDVETFDFSKTNPSTDAEACGSVYTLPTQFRNSLAYMGLESDKKTDQVPDSKRGNWSESS